jgi:hypothetical protein
MQSYFRRFFERTNEIVGREGEREKSGEGKGEGELCFYAWI